MTGKQLQALRERRGHSVLSLARDTGLSPGAIRLAESRDTLIGLHDRTARLLARELKSTPEDIRAVTEAQS